MWKAAAASALGSALLVMSINHAVALRRNKQIAKEETTIQSVLQFWFEESNKMWFLQEGVERDQFDAMVRARFHTLLVECLHGEHDSIWLSSHRGALAMILMLDQFSRHMFRGRDGGEMIQLCGVKARKVLDESLARGDNLQCNGEELAFLLMPYRHELPLQSSKMRLILKLVDQHELRQLKYKSHLDRFKRVSESRASELRQAQPTQQLAYSDADILETVCEENALLERKRSNLLVQTLERFAHSYAGKTLFVSLSGGVDSMVITDCLLHVKRADQRIVCAHVDYSNRAESHAEAAFLHRFCKRNGIPLFVSDLSVTGLLRGVTDRELYEEMSRNIRFDLYKQVWHKELGETGLPQVIFGHHQGDVVENVLSNAMKGKTVLELSGMSLSSQINDCQVNRPLLRLTKQYIYDYAHEFQVPYFKDTTPRWSTRGQVRNELLPCIERVYGKGFPLHLARLAEQSDDTYELLLGGNNSVVEDMLVGQGSKLVAFTLDLSKLATKPLFLWRIVLRKACHATGVLTATDKAVKFLFDSFHKHNKKDVGWFAELRKGIRGYVWKSQYLVVFKLDPDHILGHQETTEFVVDGPAQHVGCWEVKVTSSNGSAGVAMQNVWDSLVLGTANLRFAYEIRAGAENKYQVLKRSQRVLDTVDMDLPLRQTLLPILACVGKETKERVTVVCELI